MYSLISSPPVPIRNSEAISTLKLEIYILEKYMASDSLVQTPALPTPYSQDTEENRPTPTSEREPTWPLPALPAVLNTRDLTALMLLIVLFIANNNGVQFGGPA